MLGTLAVALALGPYSGPLLPGSIAGTTKFSLRVDGAPLATVALHAVGLPHGWVATFCTKVVCSPFRVSLTLPASGEQVIELQLIHNNPRTPAPRRVVVWTSRGERATIAFARGVH